MFDAEDCIIQEQGNIAERDRGFEVRELNKVVYAVNLVIISFLSVSFTGCKMYLNGAYSPYLQA